MLPVESGSEIKFVVTMPADGATAKAFIWEAETYIPICAAGELVLKK